MRCRSAKCWLNLEGAANSKGSEQLPGMFWMQFAPYTKIRKKKKGTKMNKDLIARESSIYIMIIVMIITQFFTIISINGITIMMISMMLTIP